MTGTQMKLLRRVLWLCLALLVALLAMPTNGKAEPRFGRLPLSFELNQGQTDAQVRFLARGRGYTLFLTQTEAVLAFPGAERVVRVKLVRANPEANVAGAEPLAGKSNYFLGNDLAQWRTNVPHYARVRFAEVYPGIDLVYYGTQEQQVEYDFVVAPGADPQAIRLAVQGADAIELSETGDLVVRMADGELRLRKPLVYQELDGHRQQVAGGFVIEENHQVGLRLGAYDVAKPLIIDPVLVYSSYLGAFGYDFGGPIVVDSQGFIYVAGHGSTGFPGVTRTFGPYNPYAAGFVTKLTPDGSAMVYSVLFGGSNYEFAMDMAVDAAGNVYVAGLTQSYVSDFPTVNALQPTFGGACCDGYVIKLDSSGSSIIYSTYLGGPGSDSANGIAVDAEGNAYITGVTDPPGFFTTTFLPHAGHNDAFVVKLNPSGSRFVYSTYLGGGGHDSGHDIAVDAQGNAYVTGEACGGFPLVNPLLPLGCVVAFVAKLNATGTGLVYSTPVGHTSGYVWTWISGQGIALDSAGNAYVTGLTPSPSTYFPPTDFHTVNALQPAYGGGLWDAFVAKLNLDGTAFVYSTFLGGSGFDYGMDIAADFQGNAYVIGFTDSANFPTASPLQPGFAGGLSDAFVSKLSPSGSTLMFSTYLGGSGDETQRWGPRAGIAVDSLGSVYVAGSTNSTDFPTVNPLQATNNSGVGGAGLMFDAFLAKIALSLQEEIQALIANVQALNLKQGISNSLDAKLQAVLQALNDVNQNNNVAAINALQAFINALAAQRGISIPAADADALITAAQQIITLLGG